MSNGIYEGTHIRFVPGASKAKTLGVVSRNDLPFRPEFLPMLADGRKLQTRRCSGLAEVNRNPDRWEYQGTNVHGGHLFYNRDDDNEDVSHIAEVNGLKAALKLAKLEKIVRQDAFGRTARKAAEWVQEYKPADADEEENRQIMLKELAEYADVNLGEKWSDSLPLPGGVRLRFPSAVEEWVADVTAAAVDALAYRAAVKIIQDQHFDGHPVLFRDSEANLESAAKTLEDGIATFNDYLKTRAELFKADWEVEEESEDGVASAIPGEREGKLTIDIAVVRKTAEGLKARKVAADWVRTAKFDENAAVVCACPWKVGIVYPPANVCVTGIRPERLHDISDKDIRAEGIACLSGHHGPVDLRQRCHSIWDDVHRRDVRNRWERNPWVWILTLKSSGQPGAG